MPVPTRRLALLALVLALPVLFVPGGVIPVLVAVNAVLVALAGADWARAVHPEALTLERELPAVVTLGTEAEVVWRLRNPTRRGVVVSLADELAPSLGAGSRRAQLVVPAGGQARAATTIRPSRRGRFEVGEVVVRVDGPLGLAARQRRVMLPAVLAVHPRYRSAAEAELRINRARLLEVGLRSAAGRGGGTEFDALREYSVDDETRRIDWAATARSGRAIVRTYRAERNQTVLCLLDNGRTMAARVDGVPRVEHAMDAVMMLTHVASRLGDRVGLLAFDRDVRAVVGPRHGAGQLARVTEALYQLEPVLVESDYRMAFSTALSRFRRRSLLVLCTELAEQAFTETLLPALPLVGRHHLVVIAAVVDPAVARWAASSPEDAGGAYRKAAAIAALAERRRVAARLRALGATVVDAPPGELAPRLADTYLRVKATGRL
jgi:uncharacterized protein (DUF58 family)